MVFDLSGGGIFFGFTGRNFMHWIGTTFAVKIGVKLQSKSIRIV